MQDRSVEKLAISFAIPKVKQRRNFIFCIRGATGFSPRNALSAFFRARVAGPLMLL